MKLKNYRFGHVESEQGDQFDTDLIVMGDWVHDNWWRNDGHRLVPDDLEQLMPKQPAKLIIGQGASSRMSLSPRVKNFLEEKGIDYEALPTERAVKRYNELAEEDEQVAGAFHLTC
ncbi:MAG: Mth938-like domain-containing protein [bacterium]